MNRLIKLSASLGVLAFMAAGCASINPDMSANAGAPTASSTASSVWTQSAHGVTVRPTSGTTKRVELQVMTAGIIRVSTFPTEDAALRNSLMVVAQPEDVAFTTREANGVLRLATSQMRADVRLSDGLVRFFDANGREIVSEQAPPQFSAANPDYALGDNQLYHVTQSFSARNGEGYYGLGGHQNGLMNYAGHDVDLAQFNIDDAMPLMVSSAGYGILWDNNGMSRFGDPRPYTPITNGLIVRDMSGQVGGLTVQYYRGDELVLTRTEADSDYMNLPADQFTRTPVGRHAFPAEFGEVSPSKVVFEGDIEARTAGEQRFRLYASNYYKIWVDGELVIDGWRQNWNPWNNDFAVQMAAGQKRHIRMEWVPNDGYFGLRHKGPSNNPVSPNSFSAETARGVNYYVIAGGNADGVVAGYRHLTGEANMMPRWAFGFWQSRQRYTTQAELVDTVHQYRQRQIPFDNIVMDWFYWPENAWGSHQFDPASFPDPQGMVNDVHANNAQIMISVWPKFYPTTANYQELDAGGHIYRRQIEQRSLDWVGPGYLNAFYDPYSAESRAIYWRQVRENLGVLGMDAWWMDASEPDSHSNITIPERVLRMGPTSEGNGAEVFNSYVLATARSIYEGESQSRPDVRPFMLTRSSWGGLQRYNAATWSGDVTATWHDFAWQIPVGINMALSGQPYWTHDIGGFAVEDRFSREGSTERPEFQELYIRWFQFGAFTPLFRSHGELPFRETYNVAQEGTEAYNALISFHRLRYRLLPYIYTAAADVHYHHSTIMRGLVMDFPNDASARNIAGQYLFGPSILAAPVTQYQARSWRTYLPAGTSWVNFYTNQVVNGGRWIEVPAPLGQMPLFVKAGAIIPTAPVTQYAEENPQGPLTILVYPGANGTYQLYEDDGRTRGYERGQASWIPISWDNVRKRVTLGERQGHFDGQAATREISVRIMAPGKPGADAENAPVDGHVTYDGHAVTIRLNR